MQSMATPEIGLPKASVTCTTSGWRSLEPAAPLWSSPDSAAMPLASLGTAMRVNEVEGAVPPSVTMLASPVWGPIVVPNTTCALASPLASVVAVGGLIAAPGAPEVSLPRIADDLVSAFRGAAR